MATFERGNVSVSCKVPINKGSYFMSVSKKVTLKSKGSNESLSLHHFLL